MKDVSRLKGAICGNPALQGGGASGTRYPVWKTAPQDWMSSLPASVPWARHQHNSQVPPFRRVPSFRRPVLTYSPPALKGGVTTKFAFQASYAFQASAVLLTQDTWVVPQKDYCLLKGFATAPCSFYETAQSFQRKLRCRTRTDISGEAVLTLRWMPRRHSQPKLRKRISDGCASQ